ncbi:hypothetical protein, partial [Magnetospirillum sp. UT-4]|uniref:hypothetical protein n=1 Tax=Magnetospirillum sp. UT-4 TaxID=2681467 RepID=UPI0015735C47
MATPKVLVGKVNARLTAKARERNPAAPEITYKSEIREGLDTTDRARAREKRDVILGQIRAEMLAVAASDANDYAKAMEHAAELRRITDPEVRDAVISAEIEPHAERIEAAAGLRAAKEWYSVATGEGTPLSKVYERFLAEYANSRSVSYRNNLRTAYNEFSTSISGDNRPIHTIGRMEVGDFLNVFLRDKDNGLATIRKKASQLAQIWTWARGRGYLDRKADNPWEEQAPSKKDVEADTSRNRRIYTPEEARKLLAEVPAGTALGDVIRVALLTGVRLEEVASLDAATVDPTMQAYTIPEGKTKNAVRFIPLVGMAWDVIKARLDTHKAG